MGPPKIVELDISILDNRDLLLKYGPIEKAEAYAAAHYSYIQNGRYQSRVSRSNEPGAIIFRTFHHTPITVEQDAYFIRSDLAQAHKMKEALGLPRVKFHQTDVREVVDLEIPKTCGYNEWFNAVSSIRQTQLSRKMSKKEHENAKQDREKEKRRRQDRLIEREEMESISEGEGRNDMKYSGAHDATEKLQGERARKNRRQDSTQERKHYVDGKDQSDRKWQHSTEGRHKPHGEANTHELAEPQPETRARQGRTEEVSGHEAEKQRRQESRRRRRAQQKKNDVVNRCRIL